MTDLPDSTLRLLRLGQLAAIAGLVVFLCAVAFCLVGSLFWGDEIDTMIKSEFTDLKYEGSFTVAQRFFVFISQFASSATGVLALWFTYRLFGTYRKGRVFKEASAKLLGKIGLLIALIMPIEIFGRMVLNAVLSAWLKSVEGQTRELQISIGIDEGHIYALVFGLLILIVAHVMSKAVAISDDNKAIV